MAPLSGDRARLVVQAWLGTRLLLVLVALLVARQSGRDAEAMLANWDVRHFFDISEFGYVATHDIAYFPGWPLLLRQVTVLGVPPLWGGVLLAVAASAAACWALYRLGGGVAAIAWLLVPTTVFTLVPYTESAFCAAAFWAWERARAGRWGAASGLAAVACTLRVSGLFLVVALAVLALTTPCSSALRGRLSRLGWLLLPTGALVGYAAYLFVLTGSWTAWYDAQAAGWARGLTWPWESLRNTLDAASSTAFPDFPEWAWVFRAELVSMGVGALVTGVCLLRRRWAEAVWVGLQVLAFSVSYWFFSVNRAVLLWFPLFLLLADAHDAPWWSGSRARRVVRGVLTVALVVAGLSGSAYWAWLFYTGRWAS